MSGPLSGYRIVDLTRMIAGPMATMILGDQGADVIKIESPGIGDLTRAFAGPRHQMAPMFAVANRNKRSVVLNLNDRRAAAVMERLVATADVLVHNFRPGVASKLGVGEDAMRRVRPDLIYVSISGFGETGPYAHKRSYDPVIQALSGLAWIQGVTGRPKMIRLIIADKVTALTAAQAITAALLERTRSGKGQHVKLAMLDAVISFLWAEGMAHYTFLAIDTIPIRRRPASATWCSKPPTALSPPGRIPIRNGRRWPRHWSIRSGPPIHVSPRPPGAKGPPRTAWS